MGISNAAVGRHLEILNGVVEEPYVDIPEGRLKKIFTPVPNTENALKEFWYKEISEN